MKNRRGEYLYFCSAEQDSLYALTLFRKKEKQGTLNMQETGFSAWNNAPKTAGFI